MNATKAGPVAAAGELDPHRLSAPAEILEWMEGSVLRPVLAALAPGDAEEFLKEFGARVEAAYPFSSSGILLPFRRLFFVARRG